MRMICIGKIEGVQVESSVMERLLREKNSIGRNEMEGRENEHLQWHVSCGASCKSKGSMKQGFGERGTREIRIGMTERDVRI